MRILFCKVSSMKYYKGANENDIPYHGGSFVEENGYGYEEFNFRPIVMEDSDEVTCLGFFEPKSNNGKRNTVHIENIEGCTAMKNEPAVHDVLVIWCASNPFVERKRLGNVTVVGWYKHATVYRDLQEWTLIEDNGYEEEYYYNVHAKAKDCVLLPENSRTVNSWAIPSANYTKTFGFGQSMVWYPNEPEAKHFIEKLLKNIDEYDGENWLWH